MLKVGALASARGTWRLLNQPIIATDTTITPTSRAGCSAPANKLPAMVPIKIATKVPISICALPPISSSRRKCWGIIAYFTGPKKADCVPMANSTDIISQISLNHNAATPPSIIKISASLIRRIITDFSYLSASWPARAENRKKGIINRPAAIFTSVLVSEPLAATPLLTRITNKAFLKRLSLRAPKNWVRKNGRKRRDLSKVNWLFCASTGSITGC